jgi:hypothetical protein
MSDPGPAQLDLIRRYERVMRELHADAMRATGPRIGVARSARDRATRQAAKRFTSTHRDVGRSGGPPTLPVA